MKSNTFSRATALIAAIYSIPAAFGAPALEPGVALPAFGGPSGAAREFSGTTRNDWAAENFQAEVTVTVKGGQAGNGIAFFGLGAGTPNPASFNEPTTTPSLVFRICPNDFGGGQVDTTCNGISTGDVSTLGNGIHRLRLSWDANQKQAWLQIHPNWKTGDTFTPTRLLTPSAKNVDFSGGGRLFVGGAGGVEFTEFMVGKVTVEELAKLPACDRFAGDSSAATWLPINGQSRGAEASSVDPFLKDLSASFRPLVCWYKGAQLEASRTPQSGDTLELPHSKWTSVVTVTPVADEPEARDITLSVSLKEGITFAGGAAAAFDFSDWDPANYLLLPASVYNANRNRIVGRGYAEGLDPADYFRKDLPLTHADVPRLETDAGKPSKLEVNSSNVTTPAVCIFDKKHKRGFILLAEQAGRSADGDYLRKQNGEIRDNAFSVEESADRSKATVVVSAPGVRERTPAFIGFMGSSDRGMEMKSGDTVMLKLRVFDFPADGIPAVLEKFMTVRKSLTGPNHPRLLLPAEESLKWMQARINNRWLANKNAEFYMCENGPWIAFGWVGGWMNTYPMLALNDATQLDRVTKTFDFGLKAQDPSGYFHYAIRDDGNTAFREPKPDMNLARTNGDVLYWMVKQFALIKVQGRADAIKPAWESSMRKLADALVTTWKRDGQWGKMIQVSTGKVAEYNTTGGASCIGGLALAGAYFHEPKYVAAAKEAGEFYYNRDFSGQGQTTGACADILQNADSETAFAFMQSLMALYDVTGDQAWLEKARNAANLASSWVVSHDYELPKFTALGQLGTRMAGVVWASTQNKHGAPGACTTSADGLMKIYRATGDTRYADLIRDIMRAHDEGFHGGGGTERLTYCDADARGDNPSGSNGWTETNGAMMAMENPGIYLRTDSDRMYVFDAVEAKVLSRDASGIRVSLHNPTKFDSKVSILAEDAAKAAKPLGPMAFPKWPKVEVKAGETKEFTVTRDGLIR